MLLDHSLVTAATVSVFPLTIVTVCVRVAFIFLGSCIVFVHCSLSVCLTAETECEETTCEQLCSRQGEIESCSCFIGFQLDDNNSNCSGSVDTYPGMNLLTSVTVLAMSDINECQDGSHNCDDECANSEGSFSCRCGAGYRLLDDDHSCEGETMCHVSNTRWLHSVFVSDVNECVLDAELCSAIPGQICSNLPGSFNCSCPIGTEVFGGRCVCT